MEFITAGFEIIEQEPGIEGIYKAAELPGRICYGSQDKIAPGTAEPFIKGLMKTNHGAPLEHGTVYLKANDSYSYVNNIELEYDGNPLDKYYHNKYSKCKNVDNVLYVTTNLRVLFENNWMSDLDNYFCEPTEHHERRYQVRFTIDRFTGEEFLRHRVASFNRESTRYVTYTKEKFGGGSIKFIIPTWLLDRMDEIEEASYPKEYNQDYVMSEMCYKIYKKYNNNLDEDKLSDNILELDDIFYWMFALKATEWSYNKLINECGWRAEQARVVLPCAINSPLIKTAFISDWKHFFDLRAIGKTGKPHPQAEELALPLMNEFLEKGYISNNDIENIKNK